MNYTWRETLQALAVTVIAELFVFAAIGAFIFTVSVWSIIGIVG